MLQHDSEAEDPIPIFANDDDGNHHHDPKHIGGRWGDRFLLLAAFLCLVATAAVVGILGVASVYCVTDRSADILERCSPEDSGLPITLPAINALTLALYCVAAVSSGCLLALCYRHPNETGFPGLVRRLATSFKEPRELSSGLAVWGLTAAFAVACAVEFGVGLSEWGLVLAILGNLLITNVMASVLGPLDLGSSGSSDPMADRPMVDSRRTAVSVADEKDEEACTGGEEEEEANNNNGERTDLLHRYRRKRTGLDPPNRWAFAMGLATALLLNGFFLCYDAAVVALRAAYKDETSDESARERALMLLSSLASVWYRAFHARFSYHKLLFPSRDVLATRFPRAPTTAAATTK